jgi:CheY-like chemotaxis protein
MRDRLDVKILVVDDDTITIRIVRNMLEAEGYRHVESAGSGETALEMVAREAPDLILLDILLPGMAGYDVCRAVRRGVETAHVPILMVTGSSPDADTALEESYRAGATDFIAKPIRPIEFLARVKAALETKAAYDQVRSELKLRTRAEREKEKVIAQLQTAIEEIQTLSGMLPICAACKKIRDDSGYWNQIENYISEHSNAEFSHSICPDCAKSYLGTLDAEKGKK